MVYKSVLTLVQHQEENKLLWKKCFGLQQLRKFMAHYLRHLRKVHPGADFTCVLLATWPVQFH